VAKGDEVTGEWRKLYNEELNVLYASSNIVLIMKSRRMRLAGHVARMGVRRGVYTVHCNIIKPHKLTNCTSSKLIF
jgi:hypothetical protein